MSVRAVDLVDLAGRGENPGKSAKEKPLPGTLFGQIG